MLTYAQQQAQEIVEQIVAAGWKFKVHTYVPEMRGWWTRADGDPIHEMRRGDPKEFYAGAQTVADLYLTA